MNQSPVTGPVELTQRWLERFVIELELCPFASTPFESGHVSFEASEAQSCEEIRDAVLGAVYELLTGDPDEHETSLLILSRGLPLFDDYLDVLAGLEDLLAEAGAEGLVQIASFHPDYRFEGAPPEDPANFTNRSPFPMFHLIREDRLSQLLAAYPDPADIPARNIKKMRSLGLDEIRRRLAALSAE